MGRDEHLHLDRILFPTDLSEASLSVFPYAADIARLRGGEIRVLYLIDALEAGLDSPLPLTSARVLEERLVEGGKKRLEEVRHLLEKEEVPFDVEVATTQDIPTEIRDKAVAEKTDLIVMGTHGRTGFTRLICGSVAEDTVRKTPCPVLLVRVV